jgi:bla regulator protein BlaR1
MIPTDLSPIWNHLWQSTVCVAVAWLLTLAMGKNRAAVRYWIWLAASVKFLMPFSLLSGIGGQLGWRSAAAIRPPQFSVVMNEISRSFTISAQAPLLPAGASAPNKLPLILLGVWLCGALLGLIFWLHLLRQTRAIRRSATPLNFKLPIPVMSSSMRLEPSIFGICKPVLILPEGITDRLTSAQLEAVFAHELCHVRRQDNLTAAIHMVVEVIFWFHPLVWWIRRQLLAERERACDEEVIRLASDPQVYAEGILNVCKFYLESPLRCVSGVTGADLKKRIAEIMSEPIVHNLSYGKRILVASVGTAALTLPVVFGILNTPAIRAQSQASAGSSSPAFDVASIKPNRSGSRGFSIGSPGGRFIATNVTLQECIQMAYHVADYRLTGGPSWLNSERYDIEAKAEHAVPKEQLMPMLQALLADRFKLAFHWETKERPGYALIVGKNGPKLHEAASDHTSISGRRGQLTGRGMSMSQLADALSRQLGQTVLDKTGLRGAFDLTLEWTPDENQTHIFAMQKGVGDGREEAQAPSTAEPSGPSIFTALQEQLGLKLESGKVPTQIFMIDHADKPSAN